MKSRKPVKVILTATMVAAVSTTASTGRTLQQQSPPTDTRQKWDVVEAAFQGGNLKATGIRKPEASNLMAQTQQAFRNIASPWGDNAERRRN